MPQVESLLRTAARMAGGCALAAILLSAFGSNARPPELAGRPAALPEPARYAQAGGTGAPGGTRPGTQPPGRSPQQPEAWETPRRSLGLAPVPRAHCDACEPKRDALLRQREHLFTLASYVENHERLLELMDSLLAGRTPPPAHPDDWIALGLESWKRKSPEERASERRSVVRSLEFYRQSVRANLDRYEQLLAELEACNRACDLVFSVDRVIGITGINPFNPDNPAGTGTGTPPPPPPPPPDTPGTLQFSSPTYTTAEGQGVAGITVTRIGGARGAASVSYFTGQESATAGADYQAVSGTLSWAAGESGAKSFTVPIVDDSVPEPTETFSVRLEAALGATLGAITSATVSIADNDAPQRGSLQFSSATYSTAEGQGSVAITVTRTGGSSGAVSVQYNTGQNSAISGADYQTALGTLTWADGDIGPKSFSVTIIDDTFVESTETFSVTLGNPTGGATLGSPAVANVSITDNDAAGPCGAAGNAWLPNRGTYSCAGSCDPTPSTQSLAVEGDRVTISPFHAGGAATFTGCANSLDSDSSSLVYFGQANHRATITRGSTNYNATIRSSGGGQCTMSCSRVGP